MRIPSIKNFYLGVLSESDEKLYIDESCVMDVADISFDKGEDFIRLDFTTSFGKKMSLLTKYSQFRNWFSKIKTKEKGDIYTSFIKDFLKNSEEQKDMNEIIDDNGQIMDDDPQPNNATNSQVGSSVWDMEKIYNFVPRVSRMYMGDLGVGIVTW